MSQKIVIESSQAAFRMKVNELLNDGYWIVPGTIGCGATQRARKPYDESQPSTKDGIVYEQQLWAILDIEDEDDDN